MFINLAGERFHVLLHGSSGAWVISYDFYGMPVYLDKQHLERVERIEAPEEYIANRKRVMSDAQKKRYQLIKPALEDSRCITDLSFRQECFRKIAEENKTTTRRLELSNIRIVITHIAVKIFGSIKCTIEFAMRAFFV